MDKPRVLIADDEEGVRESLRLILEEAYDLAFATNGEETLNALQHDRCALALIDIKMPKLDGMEVLREITQRPGATPVVMLTAYQSVEMAREATKLGAVDYISKPFDRTQVLKAVRGALAS